MWRGHAEPAVGLAYGDAVGSLLARRPGAVDFVEVPFELLVHTPEAASAYDLPVVLHCASLSLAGNLPPSPAVVAELRRRIAQTGTPWLGEHLAFVSMMAATAPSLHDAFAPSVDDLASAGGDAGPWNIGYTVSPQYSEEMLDRVSAALERWSQVLACPILIENGPVYFEIPGSTMSQSDFLRRLCARNENVRLLLDLAHLVCTGANTGEDPHDLLKKIPLERVVEIHLSGAQADAGTVWDDHAVPIAPLAFDLLDHLLHGTTPQAVTIEYNWDPDFPLGTIEADLAKVRALAGRRMVAA
ncbi:DUF692 family multinuclear iron-containing protein [Sphingomonas qilianensis]|uniref:DUF692 family multinuclear iron-containing protein n=1 Tax=Sphingomonas qilianensis TaxID=1736690 RepID=A0ABU9XVH9_9SPHN